MLLANPLSCKLKTVSLGCFEVSGDVAGTMCDLPVFPAVGWYRGFSLQNKQRKVCERVCVSVFHSDSLLHGIVGGCHKQTPLCIVQAYLPTYVCMSAFSLCDFLYLQGIFPASHVHLKPCNVSNPGWVRDACFGVCV